MKFKLIRHIIRLMSINRPSSCHWPVIITINYNMLCVRKPYKIWQRHHKAWSEFWHCEQDYVDIYIVTCRERLDPELKMVNSFRSLNKRRKSTKKTKLRESSLPVSKSWLMARPSITIPFWRIMLKLCQTQSSKATVMIWTSTTKMTSVSNRINWYN